MKKSILFSVLVVGATLLQAQTITVHQTCGLNGQVVKAIPPEAAQAVDLGLSVKWANMNVGAESPEGYGNYYAWGETSTKETYNWSTYFDINDGGSPFMKYNNDGGKTVLDPQDDAAHVNWGGSWRMPTKAEWQELYDNCTWTWTTQNGINGYKVTSNKAGYTDKFIFLPAASCRSEGGDFYVVGAIGDYWSSSLNESGSSLAWSLYFNSGYHDILSGYYRYYGQSVRPVLLPSLSTLENDNDTIRIYSSGCDDYQTFIGLHGGQLTIMTANSDQWSHFVRWQDGNTDNPRTITTNGNANYTAYFETPKFSVNVQSADAARGSGYISKVVKAGTIEYNESVGSFDAGSEVYLACQANYGYHFAKWSDGNTSQQRSFILTQDTTFTATFAKNVYSITKNAEHGSISGNNSAEYLDYVTLTVVPDYGYHFTQWSDGLKDNPRIFQITKDTTFTAEFTYDRVGTCGKDFALVWSYDPTNKVLTIGNAGEFTENMQFGVEAPTEMEELVIGNNVTAIGENAFAGISTLKKVTIGESVKTIYNNAFYNCVNLETIFNYRPTPTNAYSTAFDGVDKFECKLYVLPSSIDMYKNASVWRDFYYVESIGAEGTTVSTNQVTVEPTDNTATMTWPTDDNAASYTIQITKDGVVFCTLIFNGNGQLTGIAFAPSKDGSRKTQQATLTANGMQFTVTGLNSGTHYAFTLTAKDDQETVLASYTGEFTTTGEQVPTGIGNTPFPSGEGWGEATKVIRDGQIFILRGDKTYTVTGQEVR
ncbi:MAG: leucine-rich repeat protein [Paludibacteraceae bacterium]|nr:leucine-rich repeat protein [Paludibacteraceae bacterium]